MVFCYKTVTESPVRSLSQSPRKASPVGRLSNMPSSVSQLIGTLDYDACGGDVLDAVPERDWRLLAALARKREQDDERERLAQMFREMWTREKEQRELVEAESAEQYQRYLQAKRARDRCWQQRRRLLRDAEEGARRGRLASCLRHKEERSADVLAYRDDQKATQLVSRAAEGEARALLAAERRWLRAAGEQGRRRAELGYHARRGEDARRRRHAFVRDAAQRVAISNALSSWECSLLRREAAAREVVERARAAAAVALCDARGSRLRLARDARRRRTAAVAELTARLRDAVKQGRMTAS